MRAANLPARAARWSAAHRWSAVLGWLAFVFVAVAVGSAVGVVKMTSADNAIGDSGTADRILAREFPRQRTLEEVLDPAPRQRPAAIRRASRGGGRSGCTTLARSRRSDDQVAA
jgi:hypothetical protein